MIELVILGFIWGMNGGLITALVKQKLRERKLYRDGVLYTNRGTYVTVDSDGGYKFTPKPKGSKR